MKLTRKQVVLGLSGLVVLALAGYGVTRVFPRLLNPYAGLTTYIDVQMEDATRTLVQQRLASAQASIDASKKAGENVDMGLYQTIAEQEYLLGDLIASREAYEQYLSLNPIAYTAWDAYGVILERMGDYAKAGEAYQKAIEGFKSEEFYRDYAELLKNHFAEKKSEYKALIDDAYANLGQTTWTMIALGDWYFEDGQCDLGRDHYDVAHTLAPENASLTKDAREKYQECKDASGS